MPAAASHVEFIVAMVADEEAGGHEGARWLPRAHPSLVGLDAGRPPPEVIGEGAYGVTGMLHARQQTQRSTRSKTGSEAFSAERTCPHQRLSIYKYIPYKYIPSSGVRSQ